MSAGGSFGGNRGLRPVPPEKGVFPLDHMHLCDLEKKEYLNCLKTSGHQSEKCRHLSKKYLECRMEKLHLRRCAASPNSYHRRPCRLEFNGKARHGRTRIREFESGQFVW